jgi:hypothetical protein
MNKIEELIGKTIIKIDNGIVGSDEIIFHCSDGAKCVMYHSQDCCECVSVDDIVGDMNDLIGSPVLTARENSNCGNVKNGDESSTWTFYDFSTKKGAVTIKWYGSSNGYYSESVDFIIK